MYCYVSLYYIYYCIMGVIYLSSVEPYKTITEF